MKKNEIGGACGTYEGEDTCKQDLNEETDSKRPRLRRKGNIKTGFFYNRHILRNI